MAEVTYDNKADVLYVSFTVDKLSDYGVEGDGGAIWRYRNGEVVGVTFLDFVEQLSKRRAAM